MTLKEHVDAIIAAEDNRKAAQLAVIDAIRAAQADGFTPEMIDSVRAMQSADPEAVAAVVAAGSEG